MAYGRRNFIYHRGAATGSVSAPNLKLAAYRNKIAAILGVTVIYTAFLYRSGQFPSLSLPYCLVNLSVRIVLGTRNLFNLFAHTLHLYHFRRISVTQIFAWYIIILFYLAVIIH